MNRVYEGKGETRRGEKCANNNKWASFMMLIQGELGTNTELPS